MRRSPEPRLRLTLISGSPRLARAAAEGGVDRVMVDLERYGKQQRQQGRNLFQSTLDWDDVERVRDAVPPGALVVRLDPLHEATLRQVQDAIDRQADALMLPFFHDAETVFRFCDIVAGRAAVIPLVETVGAMRELDALLAANVIGEFHVGMNDLSIDMGLQSFNDLWRRPELGRMAETAESRSVPFGVGGVTDPRIEHLPMAPAGIIAEQRRLGSTGALLGRSFRAQYEDASEVEIGAAVDAIRKIYSEAGQSLDP